MNKKHKLKQQILSKRRLFFNKAIITIFACTLGIVLLLCAVEGIITGEITIPSRDGYRYDTDIAYFVISPITFTFWLAFYTLSGISSFLVPIYCMDSIFPAQNDNSEKFQNSKKNKKKRRRELIKIKDNK
jgi:hypothetical protein